MKTNEEMARQLHEWYLEACQKPESGFDFNPKAQEPYDSLSEGSKFLDRYIAERVLQECEEKVREERDLTIQHLSSIIDDNETRNKVLSYLQSK